MRIKHWLYFSLILLFLLHNDLFLWGDICLILGIPSGLIYHIAYCVVATILMTALTIFAWPEGLEVDNQEHSTT